ncbi:hypothetical protein ONA23_06990 [Mycoplasmopsis cynos]|uniref:hypothetical protein n=1 Tax=Mycoplasmopsis cynos TaxID=171284 RepID=UPI0024CB7058|nr:hypothetical protein [Mycoplasmopsis cynos]WAM06634.1 hypothetical protein ONA23_06990 [Mycoplasmopsis cynos]
METRFILNQENILKADIAKGIANRIPYRAELLPDVENITGALTEKNIQKSIQRAIRHGKAGDYIFGKGSQYRELLEDKNKSIDEKVNFIIIVMEMLLSNWALYDLNIIVYWNQKKQLRNM